ncbi:MAG: hypothetical protein IPF48_05725 [Sphingomonadales bacterium]|nr:hypothetical protein [Sphingomonadales bacterium]MBK6492991.1 hypothetical protein [Sphingomonadales bacterium]MBK6720142.1 hypothetical protein [Sphingomonadales bacterium]MBK8860462.1 hypothetical protein [Sphingomonadales bacterium]MBL0115863.1 hypothetical protein [Sphingomonadales bacterium]
MARGRKRKAGRRHPCGKLVQPGKAETMREVTATVLDARQRQYGVTARQAKDERLGSAIGRLAFAGKITAAELAAAELYGDLMARNRAVMGLPPIHPHSATGLLLDEGIFGRSLTEYDPDYVEKIRKRAAAAILMLRTADHDASATTGRRPSMLVHAVVCYEVDAAGWGDADLRNLSHGLEALVTLFGINKDSSLPVSSA